jgi:tetratricopeptide (TPR) repeat protein
MGQRRSFVDSSTLRRFTEDLHRLRVSRGKPSYRALAARTGFGKSAVHAAFRGDRLPTRDLVAALVGALDGDVRGWVERWTELELASERSNDEPSSVGDPGSPETVTASAQLPPDIGEFTGREREIEQILAALGDVASSARTALPVVLIQGMAGVGKTRLAVRVAHQLARQCSEVQLYVDLRGHAESAPAEPHQVLGMLLQLMGVAPAQIPLDPGSRSALYRDRLSGRRAVIVLDNAGSAAQVVPLLPGSPSCRVLVTSRRALIGLDGALDLPLQVFSPAEANALLVRIVGRGRITAEPEQAGEIARLCGFLPLGLSLAARRLRSRPAWRLADLAGRLGHGRLTGEFERTLSSVFALSYRQLPAPSRRAFRLLSLHPGNDFTVESAAAILDVELPQADLILEELLDENVVEQQAPGRYRFHDLLHEFSKTRALADDPQAERTAALRRITSWYLYVATEADRLFGQHHRRIEAPDDSRHTPRFDGYDDALGWLDAERANLVATVHSAASAGLDELAWKLAVALFCFFTLRKHRDDWLSTHETALQAANRLGDRAAEAWVLNGLGIGYADSGRHDDARSCFARALAIRTELGDTAGAADVLNNIGETYRCQNDFEEAINYYRQDLEIGVGVSDHHSEVVSLNNLGKALHGLGDFAAAIECHERAVARGPLDDRYTEAEIRHDLGDSLLAHGRRAEAIDSYKQAVCIRQALGDLHGEALSRTNLGKAYLQSGRPDAAVECWRPAVDIFRRLGDHDIADELRGEMLSAAVRNCPDKSAASSGQPRRVRR